MKDKITYILIGLFIILISNIKPVHSIFTFILDQNYYKYSTLSGEFTFIERSKGGDTAMMYRRLYNASEKIIIPDKKVYRLFTKNPLCFWRWFSYFDDQRYSLPYINWEDVRKRRGYDLEYSTSYQDF